ncbi:MAG: hypothetical protein Q7J79_07490, partial [Gemmatimonadales bacterium]|nr:hypothetical protein [Gemmatimonadales bacterium]
MRRALVLLTLAFPIAHGLAAQGTGTTAGILLEVPATPRALALGGAYAAVVGDEGSVFVNPAGLAPIRRVAFGVSQERAFFGSTLSTGAGAVRIGRFHLGLGLVYLDLGGDSVIVPDPLNADRGMTTGALISAYHVLGVGSIAYRRGMLSAGTSVKYLREHIGGGGADDWTASGVAVDLGIAAALFDIAALGFVVQNLGGDLRTTGAAPAPLPRTTRLGFTLNFIDPQGTSRLMATTDWVSPPGGDSYWAIGLEGGVVSRGVGVVARAGFA